MSRSSESHGSYDLNFPDEPIPAWAVEKAETVLEGFTFGSLAEDTKVVNEVARALVAERAAERERCAKIAETLIPDGQGKSQQVAHVAGHRIARVIRN